MTKPKPGLEVVTVVTRWSQGGHGISSDTYKGSKEYDHCDHHVMDCQRTHPLAMFLKRKEHRSPPLMAGSPRHGGHGGHTRRISLTYRLSGVTTM